MYASCGHTFNREAEEESHCAQESNEGGGEYLEVSVQRIFVEYSERNGEPTCLRTSSAVPRYEDSNADNQFYDMTSFT